jgi:hypothetical protein
MVAFDVAVGVSQAVVNALLPSLFTAIRPSGLFTIDYGINSVGFKNAEAIITQPPIVNFTVGITIINH